MEVVIRRDRCQPNLSGLLSRFMRRSKMSGAFALLDLPSQAMAVERLLEGQSEEQKLAWLGAKGRLHLVPLDNQAHKPTYLFESPIGLRCCFFIAGDQLVFFGDNTTFTAKG
jgi:hypothetical protein